MGTFTSRVLAALAALAVAFGLVLISTTPAEAKRDSSWPAKHVAHKDTQWGGKHAARDTQWGG